MLICSFASLINILQIFCQSAAASISSFSKQTKMGWVHIFFSFCIHQIKVGQCFCYTRIKQPCPLKLKLCLRNLDFFYGASPATVKLNGEFLQSNKKIQQIQFWSKLLPFLTAVTWFNVVPSANLETVQRRRSESTGWEVLAEKWPWFQ